jgi:hypothetical protein
MTLRNRFGLLVVAGLLTFGPAHAQSDNSGAYPQSDVSGNLTQSDLAFFQSDEARIRMNDVATTLAEALQEGTLGASVVSGSQPLSVSPAVSDLFLASSRRDKAAATHAVANALTAQGLPQAPATRLANAVAGLLNDGTASPAQTLDALDAFNAAVDAAPAPFLVQPPSEFLVVRSVLTALMEGAA